MCVIFEGKPFWWSTETHRKTTKPTDCDSGLSYSMISPVAGQPLSCLSAAEGLVVFISEGNPFAGGVYPETNRKTHHCGGFSGCPP